MKSMILAGFTTLALGVAGAPAQNATEPPAASNTSTADGGQFIDKQAAGEFRAPKLVGVAVYDRDSKSVGKVSDLLLDRDGTVKAIVISVGGFLGIGSKFVAVPYSAIHWQTEQRTAAISTGAGPNDAMGGNDANGTGRKSADGTSPGAMGGAAPADQTRTADPAQAEAYQGYPDRAVIDMNQAQLKSAPEFKYASIPAAPAAGSGTNSGSSNSGGTNSTTKP